MSVEPLKCIVCEKPVHDLKIDWVRYQPDAPIYGLHEGCIGDHGFLTWTKDGKPIVKPSLEQRVERLEERLAPLSSLDYVHVPPCDRCRRGEPIPHRPVYSR